MKKLSELTKKQKTLIVIAILAVIIIAIILILNKETIFAEKDKMNNIKEQEIKIEDRCEETAKIVETFYSDENYDYQFSSAKSSCMYVIIDKKEYLVKEALENNIITIEEVAQAGLIFYKEPKSTDDSSLKIEDRCDVTSQVMETFYSDENYDYQFSSQKSGCTYAILNNKEYPIKEALESKLITIEEAEKAGLVFSKVEKQSSNVKTIAIEDRCDITSQAVETFYSDSKYNYQFSSQKSGCTYAIVNNNIYPIKDALNKGIITIEEAQIAGLKFNKVAKKTTTTKPTTPTPTKTIRIEDKCDITAQVIETFYSDSKYNYQFSSQKSGCTYAVVNNTRYPIKDALNKGIITISEAEKAGLKFTRVSKTTSPSPSTKTIKIEDKCGTGTSIQQIETFYSDDKYDYQFSTPKSSCTYAVVNNTRYPIKEALNKGIITISEAEKAGLKFYKSEKQKYEIRNVCDTYLEAVEEFYSDDDYTYSFSSTLSGCLYVTIGVEYPVVDAVRYGLLSIEDLENAGIYIIKTKK